MQVCTPPPPDQGNNRSKKLYVQRWIWGRGSLSLFTEQRRLSSDAKATKSCKRKLSRSTYPEGGELPRNRGPDFQALERRRPSPRTRSVHTCSGCRCRSPPQLLSLKSGGNASTRKMSRSGLPTAPIKTQRHSPGKRAQGGHYLPVA